MDNRKFQLVTCGFEFAKMIHVLCHSDPSFLERQNLYCLSLYETTTLSCVAWSSILFCVTCGDLMVSQTSKCVVFAGSVLTKSIPLYSTDQLLSGDFLRDEIVNEQFTR